MEKKRKEVRRRREYLLELFGSDFRFAVLMCKVFSLLSFRHYFSQYIYIYVRYIQLLLHAALCKRESNENGIVIDEENPEGKLVLSDKKNEERDEKNLHRFSLALFSISPAILYILLDDIIYTQVCVYSV